VRTFWLLVALCAAWSTPAAAEPLHLDVNVVAEAAALVQRLRPTLPSLPALDSVATTTLALPVAEHLASYEAPQLPSRYAWVERDSRAFWYSAGAGAVTTLGAHLLVGTPTLAVSVGLLSGLSGAPLLVAWLGIYVGYTAAESMLSGLVAGLVFDSMAQTYRSNFITGAMAHMAGSMLSTTVVSLIGGFGYLVFHGSGLLAPFTGTAGISGLGVLTLLGALPAVVVAGTAVIAIPALVTAWALSASAQPRDGYTIDQNWQALDQRTDDPTRRPTERVATISVPISIP
jgi:hypothetical protein